MKKVLSFVAVAAFAIAATSCGPDLEKMRQDSTNAADSIAKVEAEIKRVADSAAAAFTADSLAKAVEAQRVADSARIADSLASLKGGKPKPKTPTQIIKEENKKATGGRG
jgi:hypothetical protein